jgi:hypothetical protein
MNQLPQCWANIKGGVIIDEKNLKYLEPALRLNPGLCTEKPKSNL